MVGHPTEITLWLVQSRIKQFNPDIQALYKLFKYSMCPLKMNSVAVWNILYAVEMFIYSSKHFVFWCNSKTVNVRLKCISTKVKIIKYYYDGKQ